MAGNLTAMIASIFSGGVTPDPYYKYTTLLLPGNGTNGAQNNSFLDTGNPAEFTASITGTTMTVTAVASGTIKVGVRILGSGVSLNTTITAFVSGTNGGVGVYTVSTSQTVSSTTITSDGFPITRNGTPMTQGTFSPFSQTGWGNYFNGSSWLATSSSPATLSGNFTFECWVYITSYATPRIMATLGDAFSATGVELYVATSGRLAMFGGNAAIITGTTQSVSLNTWTHVAFVRSSNTIKLYVNGAEDATTASNSTSFTGIAQIGRELYNGLSGNFFLGYISNLRINTTAVYPGAFTPSTTPLTAISGTALLTCQSNRFVDNSSNAFAITPNGPPTVVAFSPFNPTASWSAATYGGSGYFDGSGDYLSVAGNAAFAIATSTTPFTIEGWIYPTADGGAIFSEQYTSGTNTIAITITMSNGTDIFTTTGRTIAFGYYNGSNWTIAAMANTTVPLNAYSHVACVFTGSTTKIFINGSDVTKTSSPTPATTWGVTGVNGDGWFVGKRWDATATECFTGYISNLRFVNGTAVYTSAFTPPTAPLTAISNTSLLLNFTNAGIYDATSKNDLETVGNAQISKAISAKWGSGSIKLASASTDYLKMPSSNLLVLGTGDWTIESWVYLPSVAAQQIIFDTRATGTDSGYAFYVSGSGKLALYTNNTSVLVSTSSVPSNSWAYLAMTRTGATVRAYINGVLDATTGTYSGSMNCPGSGLVGAGAGGTDLVNGYIQDLRVTKGYARTITASPTAAFPTL